MARVFTDGAGIKYDATNAKFVTVPFGTKLNNNGTPTDTTDDFYDTTAAYSAFNFGDLATFAKKADNSVAGEMRDCGECHVGGGMMEFMPSGYAAPAAAFDATSYSAAKRVSFRDAAFGTAVTAFNALIDIFGADGLGYEPHNHDGSTRDVAANAPTYAPMVNDYAQTGVLEMDCLMCHKNDYSWEKRRDAVRTGKFDASRAYGAGLATAAVNGTTVTYDTTKVTTNANGELVVDLSTTLNSTPASNQCNSCHQGTEENK